MLRLIAAVLAAAWGFAGFRNMPRLDHPQASAAGFMIATSILFAYWLGRRRSRDSAIAIATARAEATAMASVVSNNDSAAQANVILNFDPSLGAARVGSLSGLSDAPWLHGAHRRSEELVAAETDFNDSVALEFAEDWERDA